MRIAMLTACYKPVINGVTRMIDSYKLYFERLGHEVLIFTFGDGSIKDKNQDSVIRSPGIRLGNSGYFAGIRYSTEAQRLIGTADIIHCHHLLMSIELAYRYGHSPVVYTNHTRNDIYAATYLHLPTALTQKIMSYMWPKMTDMVDTVIAPSMGLRDIMLSYGVRTPIVVIENGIALENFWFPPNPKTKTNLGISEDAILLAYVGRLSPEKNLDELLEQYSLAAQAVSNLYLLMVGSGPLHTKLAQLSIDKGVSDKVIFLGELDYEGVGNYLAAADLFVTASTSEGHPLTILEAMAAGLPVIAVSSPGISEIITSGFDGYLVNSTQHIHSAIILLSTNTHLLNSIAERAKEASKRFHIRRNIHRTLDLYNQLLELTLN